MRPPLGNENIGCIRGVAAGEGLIIKDIYKGFALLNAGRLRIDNGEMGAMCPKLCIFSNILSVYYSIRT